jgi:hexosaminidase
MQRLPHPHTIHPLPVETGRVGPPTAAFGAASIVGLAVLAGCAAPQAVRVPMEPPVRVAHAVIPAPASIQLSERETFTLARQAQILANPGTPEVLEVAEQLAVLLRPGTGFALPVATFVGAISPGAILLRLDPTQGVGDEDYAIDISAAAVTIAARQPEGLFRGIHTLRQLLPAAIERRETGPGPWTIPLGRVVDRPRFPWRGAMLDVSRHFFGVEDVKRYIDLLAKYKVNRLHLHLSDDQGWRVEIASWPRLATHGGSTAVGGGPGGYYTQAQYADLVAYAQARYITIVPEIDMPGHTNAALASYPELNCDGVAPELYTGIKVGFSALCVEKEITYTFVDDVVRELAAMTPGPYIHIGGDEVEKLTDDQYAAFIERVQEIVVAHGKRMMGWEEISHARLLPTTIVQQWRAGGASATAATVKASAAAIRQGNQLVLSPASRVYLDMKYDEQTELGLKWAGLVEVRDSYAWDPATLFDGVAESDVLGVEAPLWTETIETFRDIEYMAFPRLAGVAEIGWSPQRVRSWEEYRHRLGAHGARWQVMGVNFYRSPQVPWRQPD